jgi:hypothetical protein
MELILNAMRRLTLLDDIACLCFLTVRRLLNTVVPIACALVSESDTRAELVGVQQYQHTETVLAKIAATHGSVGTLPDVDTALDERFPQLIRSYNDWMDDARVLIDSLCARGDYNTSTEAALRFVSQGLTGSHTNDLVFACLLLALRCGVLNEDGTAIEWKEGHARWAPCILSLTMEKFQRIDEKVLGKSLLSALPVELSSGQTVVLLPAVNVKNDGTLSKPNITDLWPLLDAFVSSIVTLVSPEDDVPLQVTTTLYQSTYSSFLAQVEEQPGDGDADVVTDDAKRTTKKRRLNSTENGVSNDKVIEKTERTRKKRKPSPLSSPPTHPLPSKRVKRASLQQHVDTADGGSADSTTDKKTKRKSKRKRSTKSGKANKNKKATLKKKNIRERFAQAANQMVQIRSREGNAAYNHQSSTFSVTVGANENLPAKSSEVLAAMCQLALNGDKIENDGKQHTLRNSVEVNIHLDIDHEQKKTIIIGPAGTVKASSHELLCLRAVSAMCGRPDDELDGKMVVKGQFTPDKAGPTERAKVALDMSELLQIHRLDWYLHPAKVRDKLEKMQKQLDEKTPAGTPSPTAVESIVDKTMEAAQIVFLPVDMQLCTAHMGEGMRVAMVEAKRTRRRTGHLATLSSEQQELVKHKWAKEDTDKAKLKDCLRSATNLWEALKPIFRLNCVNRSAFDAVSPPPEAFLDRILTNRTTFADILTRDLDDPVTYIRKARLAVAPTGGDESTSPSSVGEEKKTILSEQLAEVTAQLCKLNIPTTMRK